jgi:hypothetical protein
MCRLARAEQTSRLKPAQESAEVRKQLHDLTVQDWPGLQEIKCQLVAKKQKPPSSRRNPLPLWPSFGSFLMSRASVFRYKHKEIDPQQVGQELKVDTVLSTITQRGDELTLSTELVKVGDGSHLWGKEYEGRKADLLTLQQEMAAQVSERLQPNLTGAQKQKLSRLPTQSPEAYQLYVKGHYFLDRWSTESRKKAMTYFQQAIAAEPSYAPAYAELANSYSMGAFFGEPHGPEIRAQGIAAAKKAL